MVVDSSTDLELQLKKRARRRLVGAIALVLLMVIFLPMMLRDRSADRTKPEVTITIPSELGSVEVQLPAPVKNLPTATVAEPVVAPVVVKQAVVSNEVKPAPIVDTANKPETKPTEVKESDKKIPDTKTETKESVAVINPTDSALPAASNAKFYVQIGVFSDADNVKKLQANLAELGYKSQTEKISTDKGEKIRLRTSNFKERNEAAIALENIKSYGMTGIVVSQK